MYGISFQPAFLVLNLRDLDASSRDSRMLKDFRNRFYFFPLVTAVNPVSVKGAPYRQRRMLSAVPWPSTPNTSCSSIIFAGRIKSYARVQKSVTAEVIPCLLELVR